MIVTECGAFPDVQPARLGLNLPRPGADGRVPEADLVEFARTLRYQPDCWQALAPFLAFDARQYRRVRLFRGETWEGLLLCWLPGHQTTVHDHGGSVGVSTVLSGSISEVRYRAPKGGGRLEVAGEATCGAGTTAIEEMKTIHCMTATGSEPAVSLHLYAAPLSSLGAWDPERGTRWEVQVGDSPDVQVGGNPTLLGAGR